MSDTKPIIQLLKKSTTLGIRRDGGNILFGRARSPPHICGVARMLRHLRPVKVGPRALAGLLLATLSNVISMLSDAWGLDARRDGSSGGFTRPAALAGLMPVALLRSLTRKSEAGVDDGLGD